jgi:hypothetical protein
LSRNQAGGIAMSVYQVDQELASQPSQSSRLCRT